MPNSIPVTCNESRTLCAGMNSWARIECLSFFFAFPMIHLPVGESLSTNMYVLVPPFTGTSWARKLLLCLSAVAGASGSSSSCSRCSPELSCLKELVPRLAWENDDQLISLPTIRIPHNEFPTRNIFLIRAIPTWSCLLILHAMCSPESESPISQLGFHRRTRTRRRTFTHEKSKRR